MSKYNRNKKTITKPKVEMAMPMIISFDQSYKAPVYEWKKSDALITWGKNNLYPNSLLRMYNSEGSTKHKMIVDKKVSLTVGQGFEDITDVALKAFVEKNNLTSEIAKVDLDYELFNGMAWEIIWSRDGKSIASMKHMPVSQLRYGLITDDNWLDYFWYSKDWSNKRKYTPEPMNAYNPDFPTGKQVLFYSEYNPETILVPYPVPVYSTCIDAIETDYLLTVFNKNQVVQGFFPSFQINFATGIPSQEEQDMFAARFNEQFSGPQNTSKVIITYTDPVDGQEPPTLNKIEMNDLDKRFVEMNSRIEKEIVQGSGVPPQMVILTAGQLADTSQREELLLELQRSYVAPRQSVVENVLNRLLSVNGYSQKLTLKKYGV